MNYYVTPLQPKRLQFDSRTVWYFEFRSIPFELRNIPWEREELSSFAERAVRAQAKPSLGREDDNLTDRIDPTVSRPDMQFMYGLGQRR